MRRLLGQNASAATCKSESDDFVRGGEFPCLSPAYAQVIQRQLNVVADCLEIDPKQMIPKIKKESGFIQNAIGPGEDAGIGQLTHKALDQIEKALPIYRHFILKNSKQKASCAILSTFDQKIFGIKKDLRHHRCQIIAGPDNPLRAIMFTAVLLKDMRILTDHDLTHFRVFDLLETAGLKSQQYDHGHLVDLLTNMAYNSGSSDAVHLLRQYAGARSVAYSHGEAAALSLRDFNFKEDLTWINQIPSSNWKTIPISQLSFPGYVKIYNQIGSPGYLSDTMTEIYKLNNRLGNGVCAPSLIEGYLAL